MIIKSLDEEQLDAWFDFVTQVFGPYREYFVRHFFSDPHRSLDSIFVPMYDSLLELQVADPSQMSNNRYVNVLAPSNFGQDDSLVEQMSQLHSSFLVENRLCGPIARTGDDKDYWRLWVNAELESLGESPIIAYDGDQHVVGYLFLHPLGGGCHRGGITLNA